MHTKIKKEYIIKVYFTRLTSDTSRKIGKSYRKYRPELLDKAYSLVKEKQVPVKRAAKLFNVPVQTLRDRVKSKVYHFSVRVGSESPFSHTEDEGIVEHLQNMAQLSYVQVQHHAGDLALHLGKRKNNKPFSNNWLYSFLKRWSDRLASIKPHVLDKGRARNITLEIVGSYFDTLDDVMSK